MASILEEFVTLLGFQVDPAGIQQYQSALKSISAAAVGAAKVAATAVAGIATTAAAMFAGGIKIAVDVGTEEAKLKSLSDSVGMSTDLVRNMGTQVEALGMNYENIIDLAEELNNKMGESKGTKEVSAVTDSLKILGLKFKDIKDMKPEEQFKVIGNAILTAKDKQKAVSAADMLMGGEANKVFGYLRTQGASMDAIIDKAKALNLRTKEGTEKTIAFAKSWAALSSAESSAQAYLTGLISGELSDVVVGITDWIAANKELIQTELQAWMTDISHVMHRVWQVAVMLYNGFSDLANALDMTKVSLLAVVAALALLAYNPAMAVISALILVIDDLWTYLEGGDSVTGDVIRWFSEIASSSTPLGAVFRLSRDAAITFYDGLVVLNHGLEAAVAVIRMVWNVLGWFIALLTGNTQAAAEFANAAIAAFESFKTAVSAALDAVIATFQSFWATVSGMIPDWVYSGFNVAMNMTNTVTNVVQDVHETGGLFNYGKSVGKKLFGDSGTAPASGASTSNSSKVDARTVNNYVTVPSGSANSARGISDSVGKATERALHANTSALGG